MAKSSPASGFKEKGQKSLNRKIAVVAICLLSLIVMLPGCDTGRRSAADVEQAVLRDIAAGDYNYQWVTGVEVIKYGEPYMAYPFTPKEYRLWPVRVYLVGDQRREQKDVFLYKDDFGEWWAIS